MAFKFILILLCILVGFHLTASQKVGGKQARNSNDDDNDDHLTTTKKQLINHSTTLATGRRFYTRETNTGENVYKDNEGGLNHEKWKKRRHWRHKDRHKRKERHRHRHRANDDDDDGDDDDDDQSKPNVIYITTTIAAIFMVCFVALVTWHLKETGRLCFKQNENNRRNTNSSQRAFAGRSRLASSVTKPLPLSKNLGNKPTTSMSGLSKKFINSVVIENVTVSYNSPTSQEPQPKLDETRLDHSAPSPKKPTSDVLERTVSKVLNDTLASIQNSLTNSGSYLQHNDVIVDMNQVYQQCEHSNDEIKIEANKDAIESSDIVNENSDLETSNKDVENKGSNVVNEHSNVVNEKSDLETSNEDVVKAHSQNENVCIEVDHESNVVNVVHSTEVVS